MEDGLSQSNKITRQLERARDYRERQVELERAKERARESQRLERDGDMEDGLSQSNKIAGESQRGDMKLFRQLDNRQTDRQTDKLTD